MRKIIHIFLSLVIVYAGTVSAYANTSIGGWSALDVITAGATNTINATKTAGGKVLTSAITIAPQAGKVGKYLLRGGAVGALALAVPQLIGDGVDWVLDPANNRVKYSVDVVGGGASSAQYLWSPYAGNVSLANFQTAEAAAIERCRISTGGPFVFSHISKQSETYAYVYCFKSGSSGATHLWDVSRHSNPAYNPNAPTKEDKYIPISTVAEKVISNAEAGHGPSQEAVKAAALEGFAAGEHDAALDAAAVESDAGTDNPTDPNNPTDPADPAAPFDPSSIISAINALKALLAGILSSITGLADIFKEDPPPEKSQSETDVPVDIPPEVKNATEFDVDYIGFSSQCPTLQPFSVGIGAASSSMTFDMTPLCELAVTIRPAIIAIAYFIGLGVIASAIRET